MVFLSLMQGCIALAQTSNNEDKILQEKKFVKIIKRISNNRNPNNNR